MVPEDPMRAAHYRQTRITRMKTSHKIISLTLTIFALLVVSIAPAFGQNNLRKQMDFDNDNKADFVVWRKTENRWYVRTSTGLIYQQNWGDATQDWVVPGDYDGDGKADIAIWREPTGTWYIINSSNLTFTVQAWGTAGDEPLARDYDGDGKTDMTVTRRTGGNLVWYSIMSQTMNLISRQFGLATDYPVPGDYDGDGKFDLGIQRTGSTSGSPATFYYNTGTAFASVPFGQTFDLAVPGDYDGDGKTDIAVAREAANNGDPIVWYVRRSSDTAMQVFPWGVTGTDLTVQNDYDGNGKCDYAIWRNTTGMFYTYDGSTNSGLIVPWGQTDDYPVAAFDTH